MRNGLKLAFIGVVTFGLAGCHEDKPHKQGRERPPIDEISSGGRGLQSKDLLAATDQMTMELLSLPELNDSRTQWTIVAQAMENYTGSRRTNYNIFVDRLKTNIFKQGRGRVTLIENKDRFHDLQSKELEAGSEAPANVPGPAGMQPQYALYGKMQEMEEGNGRGNSLYRAEFNLTNLRTRVQVWSGEYLVKVRN